MTDLTDARQKAGLFIAVHLEELAAEILEWHSRAVLRDGRMRELAALCRPWCKEYALQTAESMVNKAALEEVVRKTPSKLDERRFEWLMHHVSASRDSIDESIRREGAKSECIGNGSPDTGCGYSGGASGGICPDCGGMLLSRAVREEAEQVVGRWDEKP